MNELTKSALLRENTISPASYSLAARDMQETTSLSRYLRMARRWKWVIAGSVAVGVAAALVVTLLMTPQYSAAITLEIVREETQIVAVEGLNSDTRNSDLEFYQTQYGLLQSRALAQRVAQELNLAQDSSFLELHGITDAPGMLESDRTARSSPADREERLRQVTNILLENVDIVPVRLSRLVTIEYTSPDPTLAARIANAWGDLFIKTSLERRFEASRYARTFLEGRLQDLRKKLNQSERALVGYAANQRIVNINTPGMGESGGERAITADDLVAYNEQLAEARGARIAAESALEKGGAASSASVNNSTLSSLRELRAQAAAEYARLSSQFGSDYPPLRAAAAQLEQLDRAIGREERRVNQMLQSTYEVARARESELAQRVESLKDAMIDLRGRSIQYNILQREVDTNRTLYDGLLQRYKEIGIAGGVGRNNISIVDPARVPETPSSPRPLINLLLGLIAGLAVGGALAFALEQLDEAITDPSEMESILGVPSLGVVPKFSGEDPISELQDRRSHITEAYLTIKTSLQFATPNGVPRTLLVTSTQAAEGKSTTAVALAMILARQNLKVLLIDGDMRSPSLHQRLGMGNEKGLSSVLSGNDDWSAVTHPSPLSTVSVITAGPHPPSSADLLSGPRLDELLQELSSKFDHVIIDAPPMLGLADAPLIASRVQGVVYVVEAYGVRSRSAKVGLRRLLNSHAPVLGAVLVKFDSSRASYGYGYDYGYGYGSESRA